MIKKSLSKLIIATLSLLPTMTLVACKNNSNVNSQNICLEYPTKLNLNITEKVNLEPHKTKRSIMEKEFLIRSDWKSNTKEEKFAGGKKQRYIYDAATKTLFAIYILNDTLQYVGRDGNWVSNDPNQDQYRKTILPLFDIGEVFDWINTFSSNSWEEAIYGPWVTIKKQKIVPKILNVISTFGYYKNHNKYLNNDENNNFSPNSYMMDNKKENFLISNYDYFNVKILPLSSSVTNKEIRNSLYNFMGKCQKKGQLKSEFTNRFNAIFKKDIEFFKKIKQIDIKS